MVALQSVIFFASFLPYLVSTSCTAGSGGEATLSIFVSLDGSDNDSCWNGGLYDSCESIAFALKGIQERSDFAKYEVILEPGLHLLSSSVTLTQVHDVSINGSGMNDSTIECTAPNSGISFQHSRQLSISNLKMSHCGAVHYSLNRDLSVDTYNNYPIPFMNFTVAVYFENCTSVVLDNIDITLSEGTGVALYNTDGTVTIQYCTFSNNSVTEDTTNNAGGGGILVVFSFCLPGNSTCSNDHPPAVGHNSGAHYEITNCTFFANNETSSDLQAAHHIYKPGNDSFNFGRGGGLAALYKGNATKNTLAITNSTFDQNRAKIGAGVYLSFEDRAYGNTVTVSGTTFKHNECNKQNVPPSDFSNGGGVTVHFLLDGNNTLNNQATFERCYFHKNEAYQGGAVAFLSTAVYSEMAFTNEIHFVSCNFSDNKGRVGAAVNIFRWFQIPQPLQNHLQRTSGYATALAHFHDCNFSRNGHKRYRYQDSIGPPPRTDITGSAFGTVYIEAITTNFNGTTLFCTNHGSAMVVQSANVNFLENGVTKFTNNRGRIGAGIALLGDAHMTVFPNAVMYFINNSASENGGAIFSIQTEQHHTGYSHICFIRYYNVYIPPNEWTSQFHFQGNRDFTGNVSLRVSSLLPCVWPTGANSTIQKDLNTTICGWKTWHFDGNCLDQIRTSPVYLHSDVNVTKLYPGLPKRLNITAYDELEHDVTSTTVFTVTAEQKDLNVLFISDTSLQVYSNYNSRLKVYLQTFDTITVSLHLHIEVLPCPPAWTYDDKKQACYCDQRRKFEGMLSCDINGNDSIGYNVRIGACVAYCINEFKVIAAQCPFAAGYADLIKEVNNYSVSVEDITDLNDEFCKRFNRRGELCSQCKPGMGVSPYSASFRCVQCHNGSNTTSWLKYFAFEFGLETIVFILVFVLHIGLTTAPANGFVFFSQIMSMPGQVLLIQTGLSLVIGKGILSKRMANLLIAPYGIVGLEFHYFEGDDICLSEKLTSLHILALQYAGAVYPIFLSVLALLFVELHARGYRAIVCIGRPLCFLTARFRQTWKPATSIIDAFATFTLLAYTRIIRVSFSLLSPSSVVDIDSTVLRHVVRYDPSVDFFSHEHKVFAVLSVFMLLLGTLPVLFLLFYPFKWAQKCLNRFKLNHLAVQMFAEAFQGCYKNGAHNTPDRRFFAGIYFIIRLAVFAIYTVFQSRLSSFFMCINTAYILALFSIILLQPYKNNFYNCLDASFFVLLLLNSIGMSAIYYQLIDYPGTTTHVAKVLLHLVYFSQFIPLIYMMCYLVHHFIVSCNCCRNFRRKISDKFHQTNSIESQPLLSETTGITHSSISNPNSPCTDIPDRLGRPDRYNDMVSWPTSLAAGMSYSLGGTGREVMVNPVRRLQHVSRYGSAAATVEDLEPDTY